MKVGDGENLTDVIYNVLYERIVRFSLSPNALISDYSLSNELSVSRTPVREAIIRLVDDGLVERRGKSFFVKDITPSDVTDLYDARECVETSLLTIAMRKGISDEELSVLRDLNKNLNDCVKENDIMKALDYDTMIHEHLASLAGNVRLKTFYDKLAKQVARINVFSIAQAQQRARDEHESIFKSIEEGNVENACKALRDNIAKAKDQHIEVLNNKLKDGWVGIMQFLYK